MKTKNFPCHKVARQQAAIARNAAATAITAKQVRALDILVMQQARSIRTKKDRRSLNQF